MKTRLALFLARLSVRLGAGLAAVVRPVEVSVGTVTCGCSRDDCRAAPSVLLTYHLGGRTLIAQLGTGVAADVGRSLVKAAAQLEEHHVGGDRLMTGLTFWDLETTGLDPAKDRITQVGGVDPNGVQWEILINPGREIPPEVEQLTGITNALVADAPPFADVAQEVADRLSDRPLGGFGNWELDVPLLAEEFERCGIAFKFGPIVDAGRLYRIHEPRTLTAAMKFYRNEEHVGAHTAAADARAAKKVLMAQLARYDGLAGKTAEELALIANYGRPAPACPFGKLVTLNGKLCFNTFRNRGKPVEEDPGYAEWMIDRGDFPLVTKRLLIDELRRLDAEREARATLAEGGAVCLTGDPDIPF